MNSMVTSFLRRTAALSLVALLLPPVARFVAHSVTFETGQQQGAPEALESFADLLDWTATQFVHQTSSDFVLGAFLLLSCVFWGNVFALGLEVVRLGFGRFRFASCWEYPAIWISLPEIMALSMATNELLGLRLASSSPTKA